MGNVKLAGLSGFLEDPLETLVNPIGPPPSVPKITELTPDQQAAIGPWVDKWVRVATLTHAESPADRDRFEAGARECYRHAGMRHDHLKFGWVDSPMACVLASCLIEALEMTRDSGDLARGKISLTSLAEKIFDLPPSVLTGIARVTTEIFGDTSVTAKAANLVHRQTYTNTGEAWRSHLGGQFWAPWLAYESFFLEYCGLDLGETNMKARSAREAQMNCGWWYISEDFVIASERPRCIHLNAEKILSCDYEPALGWVDGWGIYRINGVDVPKWLVETPAEQIDPYAFAREVNAEVRREIIRKIGVERLTEKLGSRIIDRADGPDGKPMYELHMVDLKGETGEWPCLKMRNPSIGVYHMEWVPKTVRTVEEANHFRTRGKFIHRRPLT